MVGAQTLYSKETCGYCQVARSPIVSRFLANVRRCLLELQESTQQYLSCLPLVMLASYHACLLPYSLLVTTQRNTGFLHLPTLVSCCGLWARAAFLNALDSSKGLFSVTPVAVARERNGSLQIYLVTLSTYCLLSITLSNSKRGHLPRK